MTGVQTCALPICGSARISGSGKVKAEDLQVNDFEARISGSGNVYISVIEEITANISGSGSVYYAGDPDRVIRSEERRVGKECRSRWSPYH